MQGGRRTALCQRSILARIDRFDRARRFARFGDLKGYWPIFHFIKGNVSDFRKMRADYEGATVEVDCYEYRLLEIPQRYTLAHLRIGTDNWIVCLNDPCPTPEIRYAFPENELQCIWYSPKEIG